MSVKDTTVTIVPYFHIQEGKMEAFKAICERFIEQTNKEEGVLYYGFSFHEDIAHCREGYKNAEAALEHIANVGDIIDDALQVSDLVTLELHGIKEELDIMREPLADLSPNFFELEFGFKR